MTGVRATTGASVVGRAAGGAAIAALSCAWFLQPIPLAMKALAAVITLVAIAKPANGLLLFAGLAPLSTAIAVLCGGGLGAQLLEQMTLGIAAGTLLRPAAGIGRTRIEAPALLMSVVAIASAATLVPAAVAPVARGVREAVPLLPDVLERPAALASAIWAPVLAALTIVEAGVLAWAAERAVRQSPDLAKRLVMMALVGSAGAAALNLQRVAGAALRTGDALGALPRLLMTVRVSMQSDWNAGASALLLAGVAGLGLLIGPRRQRVATAMLLPLVAAGVWVTGSRAAIAMAVAATAAVIVFSAAGAARRPRWIAGGLALSLLAAGTWLIVSDPFGRNDAIPRSVQIRFAMSRAGFELFEKAPVFGIGIGRFYDESAAVAAPALATFGGGPRENAHNNFVQVLAEEGLVGLGVMLWWLGVTLVSAARAQIASPDPLRRALLLAIAASVGTWLTGHPLLVPEFAFLFWLYGGILCALSPAPVITPRQWLPWAVAAIVLVTVPARAGAARNAEDLEHLGFGLSMWQHEDVQRYRETRGDFALYLPATGQSVSVPVRRAPGAPDPLIVDVSVPGRSADRVVITGDAWHSIPVVIPSGARRFELVDFAVHASAPGAGGSGVLLRIGRDEVR